ncbi:glycoside hydrolase family 73 protein [Lentilactobacillus sp. Marseille-Q4993]|uniref:glycoside hydrolase family 73 protein n=1 Tax=Lentilactobacillus sp. Marseille-Q4993 TaxID=3039492 RepID=UPI0024BD2FA6|nr:glycoside hydrolase family 73 protein [Lentilactobacillus sp. Marseille-Q4993]
MTARKKRKNSRKRRSNTLIMLIFIGFGLFILLGFKALYQAENTPSQVADPVDQAALQQKKFIRKIAPTAQRLQGQYNVLPSITIAQAILESQWGESKLASEYNNLFGVKAQNGKHDSVYMNTQEFVDGKYITVKARFQVYGSYAESLSDHAKLLAQGTKWNSQQYIDVLQADNYLEAAKALQKDGYATDPAYTEKLISIIKKYKLYQYDD